MKSRASFSGSLMLLVLALAGFLLSGCATNSNDLDHVSERPWNQPVGWENGLPSSMSEGR
jgi:uncharacterized lipoprotein YajG